MNQIITRGGLLRRSHMRSLIWDFKSRIYTKASPVAETKFIFSFLIEYSDLRLSAGFAVSGVFVLFNNKWLYINSSAVRRLGTCQKRVQCKGRVLYCRKHLTKWNWKNSAQNHRTWLNTRKDTCGYFGRSTWKLCLNQLWTTHSHLREQGSNFDS